MVIIHTHRNVQCGTNERLHAIRYIEAERLAKPDGGVGIGREADMLEDHMWHHHPPECDIEPLQPIRRVRLDRGAGRDEEASLRRRHMDRPLTECTKMAAQWPDRNVCARVMMCGQRRVNVMHTRPSHTDMYVTKPLPCSPDHPVSPASTRYTVLGAGYR